jgi:hypothetical protein
MAAARRRSTGAAQASSPRTGLVGSNLGGRRLREFGYLKDLAITRADTPWYLLSSRTSWPLRRGIVGRGSDAETFGVADPL